MMRTLFTALLAASALVPAIAQAQRFGPDRTPPAEARGDRPDRGPLPDRGPDQGPAQDRGDPGFRAGADVGVRGDARFDRPDRPDVRRDDRGPGAEQRGFQQDRRDAPQDFRGQRGPDRPDARGFQGGRRDAAEGRPGWQNYSAFGNDRGFQGRDDPNRSYRGRGYPDREAGDRGFQGRPDRGRFDNRGTWNRDWRGDNRYDWNRYRSTNRGAYRLPRYYPPSGWGYGYRRFSIGVTLSSSLWDRDYWIDDPYAYRLPAAYGPYRWVRYYDDALLIDIRTGRVVDSVYGIFY